MSATQLKNIAIFASGTGSNAEQIIKKFRDHPEGRVSLVLSNNPKAGVLTIAEKYNIPTKIFDKYTFKETDEIVHFLKEINIDFIVLAGFLWKVPPNIIQAFPGRMVNIHPALLPKYGGKGMYGLRVHETVIANGDPETGITIHYVNENYDEGQQIKQFTCPVYDSDTPEKLQARVHELEHKYYPEVIEELIRK